MIKPCLLTTNRAKGSISVLVLLIGLTASIVLGGMVTLVLMEYSASYRTSAVEQALAVAEAGINYYRWQSIHQPLASTPSPQTQGPYIHEYRNQQGDVIGQYKVWVTPPYPGVKFTTILSQGWTEDYPDIKRTIQIKLGLPSLAKFAFLHNSNLWFGQGMTVYGPVFSNGGIRQDGVNTSTIKTTKSTYICGIETGCSTSEVKPGIWGKGGPSDLWTFPVPVIDFNNMIIDFNYMKTQAQANGVYLAPSGAQGYHIIFNADGSMKIYRVTATNFYKAWSPDYGCENLYQKITNEQLIATHNLAGKPVLFAEDTLWVEGTVNGKISVVAARFPINSYHKDIIIPNNLVYLDRSGNHKLGLIAQRDIIIAKDVPDNVEINGALLAQSSRVIRHHYNYQSCKQGNPGMKNQLTIFGSVISNLISYWNFSGGGGGQPTSGFVKREIIYDPNLYFDPPPYFPTSSQTEIISWEEVDNPD